MPRIRTIKPSFWSHPVMGKLSDATKCLALALLNYADDEGYFYGDPDAVRSFCRPFDRGSTTTRRALKELARVKFIESHCDSSQGLIGRVIHFDKHQKVDRPQKSQIKQYWVDYGNDNGEIRRTIDEPSLLERKGKERIENPSPISPSLSGKGTEIFKNQPQNQNPQPTPMPAPCRLAGCKNRARKDNPFCSDVCEEYATYIESKYANPGPKGSA